MQTTAEIPVAIETDSLKTSEVNHFCDFCKSPITFEIFARIIKDDESHVDICDSCFDAYGIDRDISNFANRNLGELFLSKPMKMLNKYWYIGNPVLERA